MSEDREWLGHFADLQKMMRKNKEPRLNVEAEIKTEIHEHRAPTDESIKILREMEDKARDSLIMAIRIEASGFHCVTSIWMDHAAFERRLFARFTLGEETHKIDVVLPSEFGKSMADYAQKTVELVTKAVAARLLTQVVPELFKTIYSR